EAEVRSILNRVSAFTPYRIERTRRNGRTYLIHGQPLHADGQPLGLITTYTDITSQRQDRERLLLADKVFASTPSGIIIANEDQIIVSVNPAFSEITGFPPEEIIGCTVRSLPSRISRSDLTNILRTLSHRQSWSGEIHAQTRDGRPFTAGVTATRISEAEGDGSAHYIWMFTDISEHKHAEEQVRHLAHHDSLTGLPNRLSLQMRLNQTLPEAKRRGWNVAALFIDLDRFKYINDTLGHSAGDVLLREVAQRISSTIRASDTVARLGGDEFVVLLPDIATAADAASVAGKIIGSFAAPIQVGQHELHTSPSIGISLFPGDGEDSDTMLRNADTAMYHAKSAGRNNFQFYSEEMNKVASERLHLESKLRQALARNEFALAFQPQFSATTGRPTGVEALVRWHHPTEGVISPARFIPIAEETGLIVELGEWVLRTACEEMQRWQEAGLPPLRVAVNVSARQLRRRDFIEMVAGALAQSGLDPQLLELEITESAVMENPDEAIQILQALQRMGPTLAIDDFGTGYSSLAYLKLFPIDHLKIDRSFVADIEHDLNDRAIAFGTIALAHSLGLNVIAEGVETEDQFDLLRSNGCDEIQGYLMSPPLPPAAAFAFLHLRCPVGVPHASDKR
ncbi:MAG TPA: EAL domain-containing protein, partial [Rhodocyclaceae bacterium]|nr:EAL domain-containing protein [Rhodocyclaceae bacterium]